MDGRKNTTKVFILYFYLSISSIISAYSERKTSICNIYVINSFNAKIMRRYMFNHFTSHVCNPYLQNPIFNIFNEFLHDLATRVVYNTDVRKVFELWFQLIEAGKRRNNYSRTLFTEAFHSNYPSFSNTRKQ